MPSAEDESADKISASTANSQQFVDLTTSIRTALSNIARDVGDIKAERDLEKTRLTDLTAKVTLAAEGFSESATYIQRLLEDLAPRPNNNSNTPSQNSASESIESDEDSASDLDDKEYTEGLQDIPTVALFNDGTAPN